MVEAVARAAGVPAPRPTRADAGRQPRRRWRPRRSRWRSRGLARVPARAAPAGPADARADGRRPRRGARTRPARGGRVEARRRPAPGAPARDEVRVFTRNLADVTDRVPEVVEAVLALAVRRGRPRRRGDRAASRRPAAPVPGDHETLRAPARRATSCAEPCRSPRSSSTACTSTATTCSTGRRASGSPSLRRRSPAALRVPRLETADDGRGDAVPRRRPGARPRGRDGEGARRALRGGPARRRLAEGQARAHARPRRARRRVGTRPPAGLAQQPPPRAPATRRPAAS